MLGLSAKLVDISVRLITLIVFRHGLLQFERMIEADQSGDLLSSVRLGYAT
jgi:hypothetical protein